MISRPPPSRSRALSLCVASALAVLVCAALLGVAILMAAPAAAVPFVIAICIGGPIVAAWELPRAVAVLRGGPGSLGALEELRFELDRLPEVEHPLDY